MITRHPALGSTDPWADVYASATGISMDADPSGGSTSPWQSSAYSASAAAASGVASGQPPEITAVQTAGAGATAYLGTTATAAWAVPVVGAAVAGVTFWLMRNRVNNVRKERATEIVNAAEAKMKENLQAYLTGPRTVSSQKQALINFDALWQHIVQGCSAVGGGPGQRCIEERQRGGTASWCPTGTGCDYFTLYRDPIANDTPVPDSLAAHIDPATGQVVQGSGGFGWLPILLLAGAGVALTMAGGSGET